MKADTFMKALAAMQAAEGDHRKAKQDFDVAHIRLQEAEKALLHAQTAFHFEANEVALSPESAKEVLTFLVGSMVTMRPPEAAKQAPAPDAVKPPSEAPQQTAPASKVASKEAPKAEPKAAPQSVPPQSPSQTAFEFKRPTTLTEAIREWFPPAPQVATTSEILSLLKGKRWRFTAAATTPSQLVNHCLWTNSQRNNDLLVRVGPATYRRRR